jgi:two-component system LytT family response regulator
MNRVLIIDDESPARAALRAMLREHPEISVVGEAETLTEAQALVTSADYDLVLLDVQLIGGTGFDLLPLIRPDARIVFVTAFDQFAVRAFEVNALDYLVKPVRPQRLAEALRRSGVPAAERPPLPSPAPALRPDDLVHLIIGNGSTRLVPLADIVCFESDSNYSAAHLVDGTKLLVRRTMKSWEDALPACHFVRVHRSAIINLLRYRGSDRESFETTLLHLVGQTQPVRASFRYMEELRTRLAALGRQL